MGDFEKLGSTQNAFWVAENGGAVHVRLADDASPEGKTFEITTREQVFAPVLRGLSYIRLSSLHVLHAGNGIPIPPPQRGAISATAGTHWIIEDCEVGYANTIGIDLGGTKTAIACLYEDGRPLFPRRISPSRGDSGSPLAALPAPAPPALGGDCLTGLIPLCHCYLVHWVM